MPYVTCSACGLRSYSVSHYSTDERCPVCGAALSQRTGSGGSRAALVRHLEPDFDAPKAARDALAAVPIWHDTEALETARLLVSELVGNAVKHAKLDHEQPISVTLCVHDDVARVEVHNTGPPFEPVVHPPDPFAPHGRGLLIVDRLADSWGVQNNNGTTVWFELGLR